MEKRRRPSFLRIGWFGPRRRPSRERRAARGPREGLPPAGEPSSDLHARIVVPRHERGDVGRSGLDIELREIRYGATTKGPYLRVVPRQRKFMRVAPGYLEATWLASRPETPLGRLFARVKGAFIGSPLASSQAIHERLTRLKALAILGSDPLSSSAYATEEMLIVLALAGAGAFRYALPIALVIAALLCVVVVSYLQTIRAYPGGGGAYVVAHENLGRAPGMVAAAALMVDYVVLVSVSVAAGVAAITSAMPDLHDFRVPIGVAIVIVMMLGNLRGIREAGTLFAFPTYFFILSVGTMILVGLWKVALGDAPGSLLHGAPPQGEVVATQGLTIFLILRAFSSGSAALTGVEAISNGVPNFKPPESQNARATLMTMAGIAIFLFLGITYLSSRYGVVPAEEETVVSMLGKSVLGENVLYYAYQAATALVLFLAANTSFNAFPLLSAILAKDRFMPQQFTFKGDRLAYSNGILLLAGGASLLLALFGGEVTKLIPLYAVGVFVSFTLSQSGMVRRWWRLREPGWQVSLLINGVGAALTAVVAAIFVVTKFVHGAWISILLMAGLMALFALIRRHYEEFEAEVRVEKGVPPLAVRRAVPAERGAIREHVVVPIEAVNRVSLAAIALARELSSIVTAVYITDDREEAERFRARWRSLAPDVPLLIIESPYRAFVAPMLAYLESLERAEPGTRITVILPSIVPRHWWERPLHNQNVLRLRPLLKARPGIRVVDFPYRLQEEAVA